jgi:hypothetical protein
MRDGKRAASAALFLWDRTDSRRQALIPLRAGNGGLFLFLNPAPILGYAAGAGWPDQPILERPLA